MSPRSRIPIWPSRSISRHRRIDRPSIYAASGVAEVWRFDGETLTIERLGPDGRYEEVAASTFLGVRPDEVAPLAGRRGHYRRDRLAGAALRPAQERMEETVQKNEEGQDRRILVLLVRQRQIDRRRECQRCRGSRLQETRERKRRALNYMGFHEPFRCALRLVSPVPAHSDGSSRNPRSHASSIRRVTGVPRVMTNPPGFR